MYSISWLWVTVKSLTWWQTTLWVVYTLYFIMRSVQFWQETEHSLWEGYKRVIFGYGKEVRVYHIVRIIFDIPPALVGLLFPILRKILRFKIYEFKEKKTTDN